MWTLRGAAGLLCVALVETASTEGGCGALGHAGRFRAVTEGAGCVVCGDGDGDGAACPAPSTAPAPAPSSPASTCYGQDAHPTIMELSGDDDVEIHRIPGCVCHASCAKCGFSDTPTGETKCIECADPSATLFRGDDWDVYRTGRCGLPLDEGAARCQLTLDADYGAVDVNFNTELRTDMATIMDIPARRINVVSIAPGSIVVTFDVYPSADQSDSTPAEAIQLLQDMVAQGISGGFAGYSAVSFEIVALPDDGEDASTNLLDEEVVLSMKEVLIIGGSVGGVLVLLICTLIVRAICCRKSKADKYDAPVAMDTQGGSQNSPASSPKSPAAVRREREAAARAAAQLEDGDPDEESEEEGDDQLSPLDTASFRDPYAADWQSRDVDGERSPSHGREGRARSSSVSSSSGRSRSHSGGRSRSGSISGGSSGRTHDDDFRRSRSGSISSGGSSHRSRSGSISGSSSSRSRSRSISGASGHRSRSGSISSGGRERSHSDGRRRSVSSKKLVRSTSDDAEIDPRDDMLRAVQEHEAAMAAELDNDSPPGSVPRSPGSRSPSHRSRGGHDRRKSVSRSSRSHSRRNFEEGDGYSSGE